MASSQGEEEGCAPIPYGAEVDGVLLHEKGQEGHQCIQWHHEDDAHNVSLHSIIHLLTQSEKLCHCDIPVWLCLTWKTGRV